ncbi:MAG TPA: GspH/FimT family protein, partial [Deltaproteobacteria bacterium]|nr:GspH/FimT family protein [Deltaproteobacteria bacterium]
MCLRQGTGLSEKAGTSSDSGVSLLELLAVLAIISIMAAIALPDLSRFASKKILSHQAEKMADIIHRARDLAMEQGHSWRVSFSPGQGTWMCYCDEDGDSEIDPGERKLGPYMLEKGIRFGCLAGSGPNNSSVPADGVSFVDDRISFSPMGSCNAGSIYLCDRERSIAIRVLPASGVV